MVTGFWLFFTLISSIILGLTEASRTFPPLYRSGLAAYQRFAASNYSARGHARMSGEVSGEGKEASCLRPLVVCGPSGVGKGTLVGRLLKNYPKTFGFCVSHTTRSARPGETNGVDYWYHKKEDMQRDIDDGKFVEYAQVHDNLYGTSLAATERVAKEGKVCILDIDVQGVRSVKGRGKDFINPYYLFIAPPSLQALEERLRGRGTEAEEAVKVRLGNAREEVEYGQTPGNFDQVIVNDDIDKAHEDLMRALKRWYPQLQQEQLEAHENGSKN